MKTITGAYESISFDILPAVAGMVITMPTATANISGETITLAETFFDISIRTAGDYMIMITPDGYFLGLTADEVPSAVFVATNTNYWCVSFTIDGTETDLTNTGITILRAVME